MNIVFHLKFAKVVVAIVTDKPVFSVAATFVLIHCICWLKNNVYLC